MAQEFTTLNDYGIESIWNDARELVPSIFEDTLAVFDIDKDNQYVAWVDDVDKPQKDIGMDTPQARIFEHKMAAPLQPWRNYFVIPRKSWLHGDTRAVQGAITDTANSFAVHTDELCTTALSNFATASGYDGNTYFHGTRTVGDSGEIDNIFVASAATAAAPTAAEIQAALSKVVGRMAAWKSASGRPANRLAKRSIILYIPTNWEVNARVAVYGDILSSTSNAVSQVSNWEVRSVVELGETNSNTCYVVMNGDPNRKWAALARGMTTPQFNVLSSANEISQNGGVLIDAYYEYDIIAMDFTKICKLQFAVGGSND